MASLAPVLRQRFFDSNGVPLNGGKLESYAAGTSTPKATYSDSAGTVANANPVILDSEGYADVWLGAGAYKFILKNSADVVQWTRDNIQNATVENGFSTGDVKLSLKNVADDGFVLMDDKTIGSASSGATGRANADTEALYLLLWNNVLDAWAPVTGGRGASASADFAANKPLKLPRALGRALVGAGAGASLTNRVLGSYFGAETHTLTSAEMPSHTHTQDAHTHSYDNVFSSGSGAGAGQTQIDVFTTTGSNKFLLKQTNGSTSTSTTATNQNTGGGEAHANMQPSLALTIMIKL